jgi:hypothetical protein
VCRTEDSCYLVLGRRLYGETPDEVIFKLNRNGEEIWRHGYRFSDFDLAYSLAALEDNAYALCLRGTFYDDTTGSNYFATVVARLNDIGDVDWTYSCLCLPTRTVPITGGCLLVGKIEYPSLTKLDMDGHEVWTREYYDISVDELVDVAENSEGYFVAACSRAYGSNNFALLHVGFDGEPITIRQFIPDDGRDEHVARIAHMPDGGFLLGGYARPSGGFTAPMMLIKTDSLGARQWRTSTDSGNQTDIAAFCGLPDGGCALGGAAYGSNGGFGHGFLARYGAAANPVTIRSALPMELKLNQNFPNPFNPITEITFDLPKTTSVRLTIYDLLGRTVAKPVDGVLSAGHHVATFKALEQPSGVYFYTMEAAGANLTRKMLLLK